MFRSKTVFVLGAGASEEIGLPTGATLKTRIAEKIDIRFDGFNQEHGDSQIMAALWEHTKYPDGRRGDPNPYLEAAWKLRDALPQAMSIDKMLDVHKSDERFGTCGKLGITKCILEAERSSAIYFNSMEGEKLNFLGSSNSWLPDFVQLLTDDVGKEEVNKIFENISILNFNYDRCVEHYLYESLQIFYDLSAGEVAKIMGSLKILHPYGSVGRLPWQTGDSPSVAFGADRSGLLPISKQIKIFTERVHEEEHINEMRNIFKQAEIIVFLGFAFHRQNLEILNPLSKCKAKRIYATAFGISKSDCNVIEDELMDILKLKEGLSREDAVYLNVNSPIELRNDLKCNQLLSEYWRSLTASL